jgi:hypothetical protein
MDLADPLDQLEACLGEGQDDALEKILATRRESLDSSTAIDLCAIDWEWRIRRAARRGDQIPAAPEQLTAYCERLEAGGFQVSGEATFALVSAAWLADSAWGEKPLVDVYQRRFSLRDEQCDLLIEELDEVSPWGVACQKDGESFAVMPLRGDCFTIGRQRGSEPEPFHFDAQQSRLIVVPSNETAISREQLRICRRGVESIAVCNTSRRRCSLPSNQTLQPGESAVVPLPLRITLQRAQLEIALKSPTVG